MNYQSIVDDNGKFNRKFNQKKSNAKKIGIKFLLSKEEFALLMYKAGIKTSDLGYSGNCFDLARKGDKGHYCFENCRFIPHIENMREREIKDSSLKKSLKKKESSGEISKMQKYRCLACNKMITSRTVRYVCDVKCRHLYFSKFGGKLGRSKKSELEKSKIKELRSKGNSSYRIAELLSISRNTVMKYW